MKTPNARLTALTSGDLARLQRDADELADLQAFLNLLPSGLLVEQLSDEELNRLRAIAEAPEETLCGPQILSWHNMSRCPNLIQTH